MQQQGAQQSTRPAKHRVLAKAEQLLSPAEHLALACQVSRAYKFEWKNGADSHAKCAAAEPGASECATAAAAALL